MYSLILTILIATSQLQNDADDNDTHQQATSNNVTTDSDPALEFDARKNDKLNSNEEENDE